MPPLGTRIGYIVPKWIDEDPIIEDLQELFVCDLPSTVMILPLQKG